MKKIFLILAVSLLVVAGCKKEVPAPDCEVNETGVLHAYNHLPDPYYIFVNGSQKALLGVHEHWYITLNQSVYTVKFKQASGYLIYPSVSEYTADVNVCDTILKMP